ncbi:MAG TPA: ABC transporter permease [Candidatus Saccharimonadales bacterium]|nr:ABC transporter permease [Candidatus Saccharimonadales bacterium]
MLGIIIGISSVVTIVSLGEGLKTQIVGQVANLGSGVVTVRPGKLINGNSLNYLALLNSSNLTTADLKSLNSIPSAQAVVPLDFVTSSAKGDSGELDNIFVAGTTSQFSQVVRQDVNYGEFFPSTDDFQNVAVIGPEVAMKLFGQPSPIGHTLIINGQPFIVHGVFKASSNSFLSVAQADLNSSILIPFGSASQLTGGTTNILEIFVKSKNSNLVDQTIAQAGSVLTKNHGQTDFTVLKQQQLLTVAGNLINTAAGFVTAIAAISLLVGGIGIMDIMLVSVSERNREIGIRKAIGATNRQILSQFLTEGLALTVCGGLLGILVSLAVNGLLRLYTSWEPAVNPWIMALAAGVSIALGLIFSTVPALKAARKDPIDALRGD